MSHAAALVRPPATPLAVASVPLPDDVDALALLAAVRAPERFYWERDRTAVAGAGSAWTVQAAGPDRFARVADAVATLPPDAVAVGGFAFDASPVHGGAWRAFPSTTWTVPRLAIVKRDGGARLVAAGGGDLAGEISRLLPRLRPPHPPPSGATRYQALVRRDAGAWRRMVERTLDDIAAGRLAKLVLARATVVRADRAFDPLRVVHRLRAAYPACAVFAVRTSGATFVGATPERLVRVDGDRLATAALAGTTGRGTGPAADRALAAALHDSPKERAEHAHVVADLRARLAPICHDVQIAAEPSVLATETVQHLRTSVTARLRPGRSVLDAVATLHPTPAICGAPRPAALRVLRTRERLERGWYGGGVGWLDGDAAEVSVAIRCALLAGRTATLYAGAGIVDGSRWDAELEETRLKLRPLLGALLEL